MVHVLYTGHAGVWNLDTGMLAAAVELVANVDVENSRE